jgi:hypothetical protein
MNRSSPNSATLVSRVTETHVGARSTPHAAMRGPEAQRRYTTVLDDSWDGGDGIIGAYAQFALIRAALAAGSPQYPHPIAVSTTFFGAATGGPADIVVEQQPQRTSQSRVTRATLHQGPNVVLESTIVSGLLRHEGSAIDWEPLIELPVRHQCVELCPDSLPAWQLPLMRHINVLLAPESVPVMGAHSDGSSGLRGWARMAGEHALSPLTCLLIAAAFPPVTLTIGRYAEAPAVQLTAYLRALAEPGWLKVESRGHALTQGYFDEECIIRDHTGRLIVQQRQIRSLPPRDSN